MNLLRTSFVTGTLVICCRFALASQNPDFAEILRAAERTNPGLTAAQIQEKVSRANVSVKEGDYLPSLEFDAADSWGYPGASGSMGIPGLAGSPFRAGAGADLLLSGTIWDFGRTTSNVTASKHEAAADHADVEVRRGDVDHEAISLYFDCVRYRSEADAWAFVAKEGLRVEREVEKFVATGQRSIVDRYLSRAQVEQAETTEADYEKRLQLSKKRLEILTQIPENRIDCPNISSITDQSLEVFESHSNPVFTRDDERTKAAETRVDHVKADYLPKLKGYVTEGMLQDSHVLAKEDYAYGVGLTFPLFDGFKTVNGVKEAQAQAEKQKSLEDETRYRVDQANTKYDLLIQSSQARLIHLLGEEETVEKGFTVARDRYNTLRGSLVDLREALRNLESVKSDLIDTKTSLSIATLEKKVFNGGRIKP